MSGLEAVLIAAAISVTVKFVGEGVKQILKARKERKKLAESGDCAERSAAADKSSSASKWSGERKWKWRGRSAGSVNTSINSGDTNSEGSSSATLEDDALLADQEMLMSAGLQRAHERWRQAVRDQAHLSSSSDDLDADARRGVLKAKSGLVPQNLTFVTVVGLGGGGKSSLVRDWLLNLGEEEEASQVQISHSGQGTTQATSRIAAQPHTDQAVMVTDTAAWSSATSVAASDLASADVIVVFMGDACRAEDMHGDAVLWAWRARAHARTLFVLPKFDEWRAEHSELSFEEAVWRAQLTMAQELYRVLKELPKRQATGMTLSASGAACIAAATADAVWAWLAQADALRCWCAHERVAAFAASEQAAMDKERIRLLEDLRGGTCMPTNTWYIHNGGLNAATVGAPGTGRGGSACGDAQRRPPRQAQFVLQQQRRQPHGGSCAYTGYTAGDGAWHGCGVVAYDTGAAYCGTWSDGALRGWGELVRARPELYRTAATPNPQRAYVGEWADGRRGGAGRCAYMDGSEYRGQFVRDRKHGRGRLLGADGSVKYDGEWVNGAPTGQRRASAVPAAGT